MILVLRNGMGYSGVIFQPVAVSACDNYCCLHSYGVTPISYVLYSENRCLRPALVSGLIMRSRDADTFNQQVVCGGRAAQCRRVSWLNYSEIWHHLSRGGSGGDLGCFNPLGLMLYTAAEQ